MSSADDKVSDPSTAPRQPFPRPRTRGSSTSDGEPIYDANGELVMVVWSVLYDHEELQKLIVASVNAMDKE